MTDIDPAEIEPWLQQCGSCDAGLPMSCTCPAGDYRNILLKVWQAYKASRVLMAEEIAEALRRRRDEALEAKQPGWPLLTEAVIIAREIGDEG